MIDHQPGNDKLLHCVLNSFPAEILVKDFNGKCLYSNQTPDRQAKGSDNGIVIVATAKDDPAAFSPGDSGDADAIHITKDTDNVFQFPIHDSDGNLIGTGHCDFSCANANRDVTSFPLLHPVGRTKEESQPLANPPPSQLTSDSFPGDELYDSMLLLRNIETAVSLCEVITDENNDNEPVDFVFKEINPAFEAFLGVKRTDCVGKRLKDAFPGIEGDQAGWIKLFGTVGITGETKKFMHYSETLENWYSGVVYQTDPKRRRFAVLFMEVTNQVLSDERYRDLFESMVQGVVYQNASGNIVAANPAAERILGQTVAQMMGVTSVDPRWRCIHEDGSPFPGEQHPSMTSLRTGQPVKNVIMGVYHPQDEGYHWIRVDAIPCFKPGDEIPFQVYTTFTDITDQKQWQDEIVRAKEKAEEADHMKSAFLANMSHVSCFRSAHFYSDSCCRSPNLFASALLTQNNTNIDAFRRLGEFWGL
jgi:PAS domain S-box-containing protein